MPAREQLDVPYGEIDPDEHPDWRAAREYGIDVTLLEANLRLTVEQRIEHLSAMDRLFCKLHGRAWSSR
jgi:hypothetical protein